MINVIFNCETADPDDIITLCLIAHHPKVNLLGVVVTPGSKDQINLVKHVLSILEKDIPVGARKPEHPKNCVSQFHYKWFGDKIKESTFDGLGKDIIKELSDKYFDLKILSGAPLGNIYDYLKEDSSNYIDEIVVQGGFAGDNIVPEQCRLEKFKGLNFCPTFNLGGDKKAALYITSDEFMQIKQQYYVSKNVCHGVVYDKSIHEKFSQYKNNNIGLNLIYDGMKKYLDKNPNGKLFHNPLAACVLINKSTCDFAKVNMIYDNGKWGCELNNNSNIQISFKINNEIFEKTLFNLA
jgi:pyrimidine-specific ribonucleoside hydrolase